ncbi:MAG: chemotaxis protein CheW [Myxococcota bacterium]
MGNDSLVREGSSMPVEASAVGPAEEAEQTEDIQEFLGFALSAESYALPLRTVHEILKPPSITEVPRAPADVPGIISVRGRIITVVDLARRLGLPESRRGRQNRILLVDAGGEVMGLIVDHVLQVFRLREEEIEYAQATASDMAEYVMGIGRPRGGRGVGRARDITAPLHRDDDILILLDPAPLMKR